MAQTELLKISWQKVYSLYIVMSKVKNLQINEVGDIGVNLFYLESLEVQIFEEPRQVNIIAYILLQPYFSYYVFQFDRLTAILS